MPVAQRDDERPFKVDLEREESRGGHALREHVGKTDAELVARLEREHWHFGFFEVGRKRAGTFFSLGEANEYVNKTLEANRAVVEQVASGQREDAFLTHRFGFVTGREAIVAPKRRTITVRRTYSVGVAIDHDKRAPLGFSVRTAYPRNDDQ